MSAVPHPLTGAQESWFDPAWAAAQIDRAITTPDPVLGNLRITVAHYGLSLALRALLGPATEANFHTWATWGSKKAGATIRQEDVPHLRALAGLAGAGLGGVGAARLWPRRWLAGAAAGGAALGGWGGYVLTGHLLDQASRLILGGNITVLDDIGRQTARFLGTFAGHPAPDPARLAGFLAGLRPGPTARGGQQLLRHAFTHYYQAWHTPDLNDKHEQMLLANLYAILHEHVRLQPYISGAMPFLARRLITRNLLTFSVGPRRMSVSRDVVPWEGGSCECVLQRIENAELLRFLIGPGGWDRSPDSVRGSRAGNWTDLRDRMSFICDLFRTSHCDPGLFTAPYTPAQTAAIAAGHRPAGPL
jgi:hypothetical protein